MSKFKKILIAGCVVGEPKLRAAVMKASNYEVSIIGETPEIFMPGITYHPSLMDRIRHRLGFPADKLAMNKRLIEICKEQYFDLLWVEKAMTLKPSTLKTIKKLLPGITIAWFSEDDMYARHNQSYYFKKSLPWYDMVFTTKSYNCHPEELPSLGARQVFFVNKSIDYNLYQPLSLTATDRQEYGGDVGFIGTFEKDRAEKMLFLARHGIQVRVWGNGWKHYVGRHPNLTVENKPVYGESYRKILCATKINLCFLRKLNRDLQTTRTMEIPACGAFMLAERTNEHLALFEENKEAAYFDAYSAQELLMKVKYFLSHEHERNVIALAGRQRCIDSDYSHEKTLNIMFQELEKHVS